MNTGSALIAGALALVAACPFEQRDFAIGVDGDIVRQGKSESDKRLFACGVGLFTVGADLPDESLGQNADDRRGDQEGLDLHVDESGGGAGSVVGVEGAQNQVTGQGRLHRDGGGFVVPHFTDHDHVGVLAEHRPEAGGKGHSGAVIDVALVDAAELIFDRIFDRDDIVAAVIDLVQDRIERGGFARAGRPGDENDAEAPAGHILDELVVVGQKSELGKADIDPAFVENPHDDLFAEDDGKGGDPEIELLSIHGGGDPVVLGRPLFGDVHVGHDLEARGEGRQDLLWQAKSLVHDAVDPIADQDSVFSRLDVDVARLVLDSLADDQVRESNDGGVFAHFSEFVLAQVVVFCCRDAEISIKVAHDPGDGVTDPGIIAILPADRLVELFFDGDVGLDFAPGDHAELVDDKDVERIRHGDDQLALVD